MDESTFITWTGINANFVNYITRRIYIIKFFSFFFSSFFSFSHLRCSEISLELICLFVCRII